MRALVAIGIVAALAAPAVAGPWLGVQNGGFETGNLSGWTTFNDRAGGTQQVGTASQLTLYNPSPVVYAGTYDARLLINNTNSDGGIFQVIDVSSLVDGTVMNLSGKVTAGRDGGDWQHGWHEFGAFKGSHTNPWSGGGDLVMWKVDSGASLNWQSPSWNITKNATNCPGGFITVYLKLGNNLNSQAAVWADNIVLTPEPASLALLLLGLPMLRRRR